MASTVGHMWQENAYCPVVTFDYNFEGQDSSVIVGCYNETDNMVGVALSSSNSTQWALDAETASIGTATVTNISNAVALVRSDYPYIAIPGDLWDPFYANLVSMGFVCFPSPFEQFIHCDIAKSCDHVSYDLYDLKMTFTGLDGPIDVTIPPAVYLSQQSDDTQCVCLISKSVENQEGFILGDPFFRNQVVTLDFLYPTVTIFSKTVTSPIVPTPDNNTPDKPTNEDKIGTGAIIGIVAGALVLFAMLGCCVYKFALPDKRNSTEHHNVS